MMNGWSLGMAVAVGVGVGAAFADSMGSIGWLLGLGGAVGIFTVVRTIQRRPSS